ncbi:hypothetical protein [Hypericibacter sp.]|uniref:hypothetical protein n=1 Tax=Hypericibacter sp. TaxID=2705401 RepID=UPI003D6CE5E1
MTRADEKKELPVPHEGGSYVRNSESGELTKVNDPVPAPSADPAAKPARLKKEG